jgi:hypothetical protein
LNSANNIDDSNTRQLIPRLHGAALAREDRIRKKYRDKKPINGFEMRTRKREKSIRRLIKARYGGRAPATNAILYFEAALPLLVFLDRKLDRESSVWHWANTFTPSLTRQHDFAWFTAQENAVDTLWLSDDEIGEILCVQSWEIEKYDLKLIGAVDKCKAERQTEKKKAKQAADAARKREKNRREGRRSRPKRLDERLWEILGKSRSWFYKHRLHLMEDREAALEVGRVIISKERQRA